MTRGDTPPERPGRRRRRWLLAALALLLAGGALWGGWRHFTRPALPELWLDGADPEVAAAVRRAAEEVRGQPRSGRAWGRLGMTLLANKLEDEAVAPLARAEALDPADPRWPYLRGVALLGRDPDEALPCLRRAAAACKDGPRRAAACLRLAQTLAANGHGEESEPFFRAVPDGPLSPCADYGLGVRAVARGDLAEGKRRLLRCADSPLTRQKAAAQLAALLRRQGESTAAEQARRAGQLPEDPPWPDAFLQECLEHAVGRDGRVQHANALERQGRPDLAAEVLRGVARDYPDAASFLALGIALGRAGRYPESEACLRRCLELEPGRVRAQYYLSLALFAQGEALGRQPGGHDRSVARFEEAALWARRATELAPHDGEAHFQLGLALWCLGRREDAAGAFRQAVATRPDLADAHLWLGKVLAEQGRKEEAERHLRDAARYAAENDPRPRQALEALRGQTKP
jgi:tetratricopeptide (TPR) repeat protein